MIELKPAIESITWTKNDTFACTLGFYQKVDHIPIDVSADTFRLRIRGGKFDSLLFDLTLGSGLTFTSPNFIEVFISDTDMNVPADTYRYDLARTTAGVVRTLLKGFFIIVDDE